MLKRFFLISGILISTNLTLAMEEGNSPDIDKNEIFEIIQKCHQLNEIEQLIPTNNTKKESAEIPSYLLNQKIEKIDEIVASSIINNCPKSLKDIIAGFELLGKNSGSTPEEINLKYDLLKLLPRTMLFAGTPGCGKSTLAKIIAQKSKIQSQFIATPAIANEYQNSGVQNLIRIFSQYLNSDTPIIIIFDEINSLTDKTENDKSEHLNIEQNFMVLLDQCKERNNIFVIGTTNDVTKLSKPIRDRFSNNIYKISMPNYKAKQEMILYYAKSKNNLIGFVPSWRLWWFTGCLKDFSSREIKEMVQKANYYTLLRKITVPSPKVQDLTISDLYRAHNELCESKKLTGKSITGKIFNEVKKHWPILLNSTISLGMQYQFANSSLNLTKDSNKKSLEEMKEQNKKTLWLTVGSIALSILASYVGPYIIENPITIPLAAAVVKNFMYEDEPNMIKEQIEKPSLSIVHDIITKPIIDISKPIITTAIRALLNKLIADENNSHI